MAIVKFVSSGCSMNNILNYVMRDDATSDDLIDGFNCSPESANEEFKFTKQQFNKTDGRSYYHIIQSFSPEDNISPEKAHEIGMKFAEYFPSFQVVVATHTNREHLHNHLIMNSVSFENGKKYHQSRDDMLAVKEFSNTLCKEYGLSVTESKTRKRQRWKENLKKDVIDALSWASSKEEFIDLMNEEGYQVKWEDNLKYVTFTTPEGYKIRDNKLFDERLLKNNMELYFAMGGTDGVISEEYLEYETPETPTSTMTVSSGLLNFIGDFLSVIPPESDYTPEMIKEMNPWEKMRIEQMLGRKISSESFVCYCNRSQREQENGFDLIM